MRDHFLEFVDLLSRPSVINGSLENELLGRVENQIESRRLNSFYPNGFSKINRHSIYPLISDAIDDAFSEDIASDPKLLGKMYVRTPDRVRFDTRVRVNIQRRSAVTNRSPIRGMRERADREVRALIETASRNSKPLAMLVLGQVGSGKTTFLEYTRQVSAKEIFETRRDRAYPHWFYVDFRNFAIDENPLEFLISSILVELNKDAFLSDYDRCLKYAYKDEIEALFRGPLALLSGDEAERRRRVSDLIVGEFNEKKPYVEKVLSYASRNAGIFLVVDNIDQIESEEVQSEIFANAMAFSRKIGSNLVCAMRESTYVRHRNDAIFDAFDFDPIAIEAPLIQSVVSKRFLVARELLEGKKGSFIAENGARVQVNDLARVIDLVQGSVLGTTIGALIEVLSTSDVRLALRMTREFLHSGWTASGKALRIFQETGRYLMPAHEALRAIMIGNQTQYYEQHSVVANPFDSRIAKNEAQLLRFYVLTAIVQMGSEASFRSLDGEEVRTRFRELGFGDSITLRVLEDLCKARFLHTEGHGKPSFETSFIVSRFGAYIARVFITDMMFLENVMMDTFIADKDIWDTLKSLTDNIYAERNTIRRLSVRRERCKVFFSYLAEIYKPLREESIRRGFPSAWCSNPFESARNQFELNLNKIARSAERNYG